MKIRFWIMSVWTSLGVFGFLSVSHPVSARPVKLWSPEELTKISDVIVIGEVTEVSPAKKEGVIRFGEKNPEIPVTYHTAKFKVTKTVMGKDVAEEIEIEFSRLDFEKAVAVINGPNRFTLAKDHHYLLYLRVGPDGNFVGALDGNFDDDQAAVLIDRAPAG